MTAASRSPRRTSAEAIVDGVPYLAVRDEDTDAVVEIVAELLIGALEDREAAMVRQRP